MALTWWLATCALAQSSGYSMDIELLNTSFGARATPGIASTDTDGAGAFRVGTTLQYQDDPLTVYDAVQDVELGAVVARRAAWNLGISADLSERFTVDASLPGASSWRSEVPEFSGDGTGLGDAALGARWVPFRSRVFAVGGRAAIRLPTGRVNAFLGERGVRATPALLASAELGPVLVSTEAAAHLRPRLTTEEDLQLGPEARWNTGARVHLPDATRMALTSTLLTRVGLDRFAAAENGIEALAGVQIRPSRDVTVDLAGGRGLNEGYGTTDLRLVSSVSIRFRPPPDLEIRELPPLPPPLPPVADLPDPEPEPDFGQKKVVVSKTRFHLAQQPRFVVNEAVLLPESKPLIDEIAQRFREHPELAHVVIEGHASQEGSYGHNYDLSLRRAHAIWQALVEAGVDQDRISFRAKGETEPLADGTSEQDLQRNRRVEFRIVRRHEGAPPAPRPAQPLPWSGELVAVPPPT